MWQHPLLECLTPLAYNLALWNMPCLCSWDMKEGSQWGSMTPESPKGKDCLPIARIPNSDPQSDEHKSWSQQNPDGKVWVAHS